MTEIRLAILQVHAIYNYPDMKVLSFKMHMVFREKGGGEDVEKDHYSHQILKVEEALG
jgi:hypothetical protein